MWEKEQKEKEENVGEGAEREGGECGRRKRIGAMEQDQEEDVGEGAERGGGGCWRRSKRRMRTWGKEQKEEQVVGVGGDHGRSRRKGGRGTGQEKKSCVSPQPDANGHHRGPLNPAPTPPSVDGRVCPRLGATASTTALGGCGGGRSNTQTNGTPGIMVAASKCEEVGSGQGKGRSPEANKMVRDREGALLSGDTVARRSVPRCHRARSVTPGTLGDAP
ncbi:unnamed protein product [Gadus morhua 'NCC']